MMKGDVQLRQQFVNVFVNVSVASLDSFFLFSVLPLLLPMLYVIQQRRAEHLLPSL